MKQPTTTRQRIPESVLDEDGAPASETRPFSSAAAFGSAIVMTPTRYVGAYAVENLSASSALLIGEATLAVGERVRILLQLHHQSWRFPTDAVVVRQARRGDQSVFAVQFPDMPEETLAHVRHALRQAGSSAPAPPMVLLFDASLDEGAALYRSARSLGVEAIAVQTAMDAIAWLGAKDVVFKAAVLRPRSRWPGQMLQFLAAEHPNVRRVVMSSGDGAIHHEDGAESGLVDARLAEPWDRDALSRALRG